MICYPMEWRRLLLLLPFIVGMLLPSSSASRYYVSRLANQKGIICWVSMTTTTRARAAKATASSSSSSLSQEGDEKQVARKKQTTATKAIAKQKATTRSRQHDSDTTTGGGTATAAAAHQQQQQQSSWYNAFTRGDEEYNVYMRDEWGVEKRGDVALFEKLCLEGAQSGLSWLTILRKREAYRRVFFHFDPSKVAAMTDQDVDEIMQTQPVNKGSTRDVVVRHRGKLEAVINNAKCLVKMQQDEAGGGDNTTTTTNNNALDTFLWSFVQNKPILNRWSAINQCPSKTAESESMSKALKKMGWRFVGPTTCYAMMQSVGMVIDHPMNSEEWKVAQKRLQARPGGYQDAA